jgi:hypothetical protein
VNAPPEVAEVAECIIIRKVHDGDEDLAKCAICHACQGINDDDDAVDDVVYTVWHPGASAFAQGKVYMICQQCYNRIKSFPKICPVCRKLWLVIDEVPDNANV